MAEETPQQPPKQDRVLAWLLKEWTSRLALALQSMTGSTPAVEITSEAAGGEDSGDAGQLLWWAQPFQPMTEATIWVGAPASAWSGIGAMVLTAAGVEDPSEDDLRGTYLEVVRQALSGVAQSLAGLMQADVRCEAGAESASGPPGDLFPVQVRFNSSDPLLLSLAFSPGFARWTPGRQPASQSAPPEAADPPASVADGPDGSRTIDLLYDVELPVSVSFGRAHLPLKDVLKLTSGSIVELNRTVTEPVEVIVNNCVVARGEVVVVDGNYGVRIVEIVSRRERLRTLY
jgi:flagellar motor switch protein FliN/FliY